jgi:hypothetical protein
MGADDALKPALSAEMPGCFWTAAAVLFSTPSTADDPISLWPRRSMDEIENHGHGAGGEHTDQKRPAENLLPFLAIGASHSGKQIVQAVLLSSAEHFAVCWGRMKPAAIAKINGEP